MKLRGLIFDINGTLTDIRTNEWHDDVYRVISNLLSFQGIQLPPGIVKELFFKIMKEQRLTSGEHYPEFDAVKIFKEIITSHATDFTKKLPRGKLHQLPRLCAEVHRSASRFRLQLYPGVRGTLNQLRRDFALGAVSDAQSIYATAELEAVGLTGYFDPVIVSGDFGYRKPDKRLFESALAAMKLNASEVLFVGNDIYRDIEGAQNFGMKSVLFKSDQGLQEKAGVNADYIIYAFPELLNAIRFLDDGQKP